MALENTADSTFQKIRRQGADDSILTSDPHYDDWYIFDEHANPVLPPDFSLRLGIHLMVLIEKHTSHDSINTISGLLTRHIVNSKMYVVLFKVLRLFLNRVELSHYLTNIWKALLNAKSNNSKYPTLFDAILSWLVDDFYHNKKRNHFLDNNDNRYTFSFLAVELGDNFISLNEANTSNTDLIRNIYTMLIDIVMENIEINEELANEKSILLKNLNEKSLEQPYNERYPFYDLHHYLDYRGSEFGQTDYSNLGISHQPETIRVLVRNIDVIKNNAVRININNKLIKRDEEIRKKLRTRALSDEEFVASTQVFTNLLNLFYLHKRFKYDIQGVSVVRVFAKLAGSLFGFLAVIYSFIDPDFVSIYEGFAIFISMTVYSQAAYSQRYFKPALPLNYSKELSKALNTYFEYFRKMNKEQMLSFFEKQIRNKENVTSFFLIPKLLLLLHKQFPTPKHRQDTEKDVFEAAYHLQTIINEII